MKPFQPMLQALLFVPLLFSCTKEITPPDEAAGSGTALARRGSLGTYYSEPVTVGSGTVRTFVVMADAKVPVEIGVEMTAGALQGLPEEGHPEWNLRFPVEAQTTTPFRHLGLNWNPEGHPPAPIYAAPHFDFHFYTIPEGQRLAIPAYSNTTAAKFDKLPPAGYMPAAYVPGPGGEEAMGKHWIDPRSPEFQGGTFTSTMIYGSYNGQVIFVEPMITRDFLLATTSFSRTYPQPAHFAPKNRYYPTRYNVYQEHGNYYVTLSEFVQRK